MDIKFKLTQPFTKNSLLTPNYVDPLDVESYQILSELTRKEPERLANFGNSEDYLLLRSPSRSTCTAGASLPLYHYHPISTILPLPHLSGVSFSLICNLSFCFHIYPLPLLQYPAWRMLSPLTPFSALKVLYTKTPPDTRPKKTNCPRHWCDIT